MRRTPQGNRLLKSRIEVYQTLNAYRGRVLSARCCSTVWRAPTTPRWPGAHSADLSAACDGRGGCRLRAALRRTRHSAALRSPVVHLGRLLGYRSRFGPDPRDRLFQPTLCHFQLLANAPPSTAPRPATDTMDRCHVYRPGQRARKEPSGHTHVSHLLADNQRGNLSWLCGA